MNKIPADIKKEIEKLIKELNEHNYRYYVLDAPVISDEEYDRMFRRLKELEEQYRYVLPDSPGIPSPCCRSTTPSPTTRCGNSTSG